MSRCPRWASRSPRAPSSSGRSSPATGSRRDEIIASISTDKIDTDVEAPASGRVQEVLVEVGTTVDVGVVLARIATDAKPGEAHASESESASGGTSEAEVAMEAPGEAGDLSGDTTDDARRDRPARARRRSRRSGPRRYSPVVMRIAAEHGIDLEQVEGTGRGGRVRKPDVLAYLENGGAAEEAPMHIESPYKPDAPARRASRGREDRAGRRGGADRRGPAALAHAPVDRPGDGRLAPDGGDVHDDHRGRPDRDRGRPREDRPDLAALRGARDDRGAGRLPVAQRDARGRDVHRARVGQPRDRGLARHGRPDRPGHPATRRTSASRGSARRSRGSRARRATTSSRPTTSAAARSRSPTPAATARSWRRR